MDERENGAVTQGDQAATAIELHYRLNQQELIAEYGRFALTSHELDDLLQEASRLCARGLQTKFCKIMEYLSAEKRLFVRAGVGWRPGVVGSARVSADAGSPTGYAYQSGEPVISNHLATESRFRTPKLLQEHGVKRAINVAIESGGARFGILEVDGTQEGQFTEADTLFLQAFAHLIGLAIDRQLAESKLKEQLDLQMLMNAEIGHRVKNSLAIVAGVLALQSRTTSDPSLRSALAAAEARIHTIADVHDHLWRSSAQSTVNLSTFVTNLCTRLAAAANGQILHCQVAAIEVPMERAVSLGLLINELVMNAIKYAYPNAHGEVRVTIALDGDKKLRLEVSDRGIGLASGGNEPPSQGLGMKLISTLTRQLSGEMTWEDCHPGTRFILTFER